MVFCWDVEDGECKDRDGLLVRVVCCLGIGIGGYWCLLVRDCDGKSGRGRGRVGI